MLNLPQMEAQVQARWRAEKTFENSNQPGRPVFNLLDGPPTMNGTPGVHHVEARAFKDLVGRYKTMTGHYVPRRAGWDCHGLPVELSVAQELGLNGKAAVEAYGLEKFNDACRVSVEKHQKVFEDLTTRMGYWVGMSEGQAWRTMDNSYVEKLWETLSVMNANGHLVEDFRVAPWCTSCATALSSHEVAQGASSQDDVSVTVRFSLPELDADMLVWTTTPWTLAENLLMGVDADGDYDLTWSKDGRLLAAAGYVEGEVIKTFKGHQLEGMKYLPVLGEPRADAHKLVTADFVNAQAGTGFVHLAPAYGQDDLNVARSLSVTHDVGLNPDGTFTEGPFKGLGSDNVSVKDLEERGVRVHSVRTHTHERAVCWRCKTPLVNLARPSWYLRTTNVRDGMLEFNSNTTWHPDNDRYQKWVEGNVDWALTRERFWGSPMPVWKCESGHFKLVKNRAELTELSGQDQSSLELHRPYVDTVTFNCDCGESMTRVPEVLDTWFDSGAAPVVTGMLTSDLVSEGVDQTRGWFYTLNAVAALSGNPQPFKEVLSLGLIMDANGEKMSKSKGNVVDPFELFDTYGADSVRWTLLCDGSAWSERRFSAKSVQAAGALMAKMSACAQLALTADGNGTHGTLEDWLQARLEETTVTVTAALEEYNALKAGTALEGFLEDLSGRYLRARRSTLGGESAALVKDALLRMALLMAPFTPHYSEHLYELMGGAGSVHHAAWPAAQAVNTEALLQGAALWELVEEGRSARARENLRLRQPLNGAVVAPSAPLDDSMLEVLKEQLNLKSVTFNTDTQAPRPNWKALGRRFGKGSKAAVASVMTATSSNVTFEWEGKAYNLLEGEDYNFELREKVRLDGNLTPQLLLEGQVADLLRKVVDARRALNMKASECVGVCFTDPAERSLALAAAESLKEKNCYVDDEADLKV